MRPKFMVIAIMAAWTCASCYNTRTIRIADIPRISATGEGPGVVVPLITPIVGGGTQISWMHVPKLNRIRFRDPTGGSFTVRGSAHLLVRTTAGVSYTFRAPVRTTTYQRELLIRGSNRAGRLALKDIARAEVKWVSISKTMLATLGITLGVLAGLYGTITIVSD